MNNLWLSDLTSSRTPFHGTRTVTSPMKPQFFIQTTAWPHLFSYKRADQGINFQLGLNHQHLIKSNATSPQNNPSITQYKSIRLFSWEQTALVLPFSHLSKLFYDCQFGDRNRFRSVFPAVNPNRKPLLSILHSKEITVKWLMDGIFQNSMDRL